MKKFSIKFNIFLSTILLLGVSFSIITIALGVTPNPGHPFTEVGDGIFAVTGPTALRTFTFPDANATVATLGLNNIFTIAQTVPTLIGGTAIGSSLSLQSTSGTGTTDHIKFLVGNNGATEAMRVLNNGNVGIGTAGPDRSLDVLNAAAAQLRLTSTDGTVYGELYGDASGDLQISTTGTNVRLNTEDLWVCSGGCASSDPTGTGSLIVETGIKLDSGATLAFANTDVVLTHTTDTLTLTGGSLVATLGAGSVVPTSVIGSYTRKASMLGGSTIPDSAETTGDAFFQPYSILATNDTFKPMVLILGANNAAAPTVKSGVFGTLIIPKDFSTTGTTKVYVYWTSTLITGDAVFDLDYRCITGNDTESLDQATFQESLTVTDTAPGATNRQLITSVTLTSSNCAADDIMEFRFGRDGVDAADTMAGSATVFDLVFEYTT